MNDRKFFTSVPPAPLCPNGSGQVCPSPATCSERGWCEADKPQPAKALQLATKADDIAGALETLDILREAVKSGQVIAFCGVAIEPDDCTTRWQFSTRPVTKLRMLGAVSSLAHHLHDD